MTEKIIRKILEDATKGASGSIIITRPLNEVVDYAKVWPELSLVAETSAPFPLTCYFIRHAKEGYIAAIVVMDSGLYWYLPASYRKPEALAAPLRTVILPHLLQHKPIQRLTLSKAELGERGYQFGKQVAAGFQMAREETGVCRYVADAMSFKDVAYIRGMDTGIAPERITSIKTELGNVAHSMERLKIELELKSGISVLSEDLGDIAKSVNNVCERL